MLTDGITAYLRSHSGISLITEPYKLTLMDLGSLSCPPKLCLKLSSECILNMKIAFLVYRQKLYQSLLLHSLPF